MVNNFLSVTRLFCVSDIISDIMDSRDASASKNRYDHNFQNIASKLNQPGLIDYEPTLICFGSDILKIVAVSVFFNGSF